MGVFIYVLDKVLY